MLAMPKIFANARIVLFASLCFLLGLQGCKLFGSDDNKPETQTPTYRGYFRIASPVAGDRLKLDSNQTLLWAPSDSVLESNVRISLFKDDKLVATLVSSATNSGAYIWRPITSSASSGYRWGSGDNYRIRIASTVDTSLWDMSGAFSLGSQYSGSVAVTSPAAGAQVRMDSTYAIRWETSGEVGTYFGIQVYKDTLLLTTLTSLAQPSGYYLWSSISAYLSSYGSGGDYRIRVFSVSNPAIANYSSPFSIVSSYSGGFKVNAPEAGDTLTAGVSSTVSWSATGNPGTGARITLWRDSVQTSTLSSSNLTSGSLTFTPSISLVSSNRYRIRVASISDPGIFAYSGYFRISGMDADEYEGDDSLRLAKNISVDGKAQQRTLTSSDLDWVGFSASLGKRYLVSAKSSAASMYLYLYDSAGRSLTSASASYTVQAILAPTRAGKYYARISPYSGYGAYTLSITEYDSASAPFNIAFSSPTEKSTWAAGTSYTIQYAPDSAFFGNTINLALYQDTTLVQSIYTALNNSGSYTWTIPASLFSSDRYRIRISNYSNSAIFSYSDYFSISGATPDDYEPDNAKTSAKLLSADGMAQTHTLSSGDVDWVRFPAQTGKRYIASVKTNIGSVEATAYATSSTSLGYQTGSQFSLVILPTVAGDHYIQILPYTSSTSSYTISLIATDTTSAGIPMTFTSPDSSTIWAAGSIYTVGWRPDSSLFGTTVSLSLYQDNVFVRTIYSGLSNSGTYSWSIPLGLTTSNRYRVRVASYNNSTIWGQSPAFTISGITSDTFELDNTRPLAKTIATDGVAQQRNIVLNDTDWVAFDAVMGKSYIVSANAVSSVYLYLTDSLGSQLQYSSGVRPSLVLNPTRAGKYYARVQYYSATTAYALSVIGFASNGAGLDAKFTAPAESTTWATSTAYSAAWTPDSALFGTTVSLALYRDTTLIQSLISGISNVGRYSVSMPAGLASSSRYRLRLSNYSLPQVFGYSPYFTVSGLAPDSLEPNDSVVQAHTLAPNSGRRNLSLSLRDRDWFKFTAKAKKLYLLQTASPTSMYTTTRLMNAAGTLQLLIGTKASSLDSVNTLSWVCPSDDIYTVSVDPSSTSYYGNYGFEIKEVDPESYAFSVTSPAAAASVKMGSSQLLTWTDPAGIKGYVDIFLYNAAGVVQTVIANTSNTGSYSWFVPTTLATGTDYYLKVISRSSDAISGSSAIFSITP